MTERRRWILRWILAIAVVVVLTAGSLWRVATSRDVVDSVPLSTGQYNIRFLKADVGTLRYSSDDRMRAFLRPRLPGALVKRLGEVTTVSGFTASQPEHGEPPLILLFQLLTPQDGLQNNTARGRPCISSTPSRAASGRFVSGCTSRMASC
jgi:hypothetical protein